MKLARIVSKGKASLEEQAAVKQAFHELMTSRVKRVIAEKRRTQRNTVTADNLNSYLDGFPAAKAAQQDETEEVEETFGDGMKAIASGIANVVRRLRTADHAPGVQGPDNLGGVPGRTHERLTRSAALRPK
jgi:hypothetical protein